jgi:predicted transcriptional regulator
MDGGVVDECLEALAHEQRRELLRAVRDTDDVVLSEFVRDQDREAQSVETELVHRHIPKLTDLGLITYDDTETIMEGERFDDVRPLLDTIDQILGSNESVF